MQIEREPQFMARAYAIARRAVAHGNHPFGALLVRGGEILGEYENEVVTTQDVTRHAETGLVSRMSAELESEILASSTLVTSTEPCIMCCGAIHWAGIGAIVFGVRSREMVATFDGVYSGIPCREVFARLDPAVVIEGPMMEDDGLRIHRDFWPDFLSRR